MSRSGREICTQRKQTIWSIDRSHSNTHGVTLRVKMYSTTALFARLPLCPHHFRRHPTDATATVAVVVVVVVVVCSAMISIVNAAIGVPVFRGTFCDSCPQLPHRGTTRRDPLWRSTSSASGGLNKICAISPVCGKKGGTLLHWG